jgi:hypothetical protein
MAHPAMAEPLAFDLNRREKGRLKALAVLGLDV